MNEPRVLCICPWHRKPEWAERSSESFNSQSYLGRVLLCMDTSTWKVSIGVVRNRMIAEDVSKADLIAHFDYDDWSAPDRLADQVAFMQETGADVTGYSDMLFYDEIRDKVVFYDSRHSDYCLGTSLLYKREVWERNPFPDSMVEDTTWENQLKKLGVKIVSRSSIRDGKPLMIATIHSANTSKKIGAAFKPSGDEMERQVRSLLAASIVAQ